MTHDELMKFILNDKTMKRLITGDQKWKNVDGQLFSNLEDNQLKAQYGINKAPHRSCILNFIAQHKNQKVNIAQDPRNLAT